MRRETKSRLIAAVTAAAGGLFATGNALAVNYVWTDITAGNASGSWATGADWTPVVPGTGTTAADTANFATLDITASSIITLDAPQSISVITFGDTNTTTPAGWTIDAASPAVANNATDILNFTTTDNPTINVVTAGQVDTINATLSDASVSATTWGLVKGGPGTLVLTANNSTLTGIIYINNGTLSLNFNNAWSPLTNIIGDTSSGSTNGAHLELQGGTLNLTGGMLGANSQTFSGGTNAGIGAASITLNQTGANSLSLNLGAITRGTLSEAGSNVKEPGATIDVTLPASGTVSASSPTGAGGIITDTNGSDFMTVNGGTDWAALSGGNIVPGSTVAGFYTPSTTSTLAGNADMVANTTLTAATTISSLRQNDSAAHTLDLGGTTLNTGGILMTAAAGGALTIQDGKLLAPNALAADIIVNQNNTSFPLTISASIQNNGANFTALTKNGPGTLILTGANTASGDTVVNQGTLSVTAGTLGVVGSPYIGMQIAPAFGNTATMNISGAGTIVSDDHFLIAGNENNFAGGTGTVNQTGGAIVNGAWFTVGGQGTGTYNFSAGTNTVETAAGGFASLEMGVFATSSGTVNMSGSAVLLMENGSVITMGDQGSTGSDTFNQNGGTVTFYSDGGVTPGGGSVLIGGSVVAGAAGGGADVYNLNGGTLTVPRISRTTTATAGGTGTLNLNGGTLVATGNAVSFINSLTAANVQAGGAIINTNGFAVTVPQPLIHAAALGATVDGGLTKIGAGTLILSGAATYTGPTKVTAGTLQLPSNATVPPPTAIGSYSFDTINGSPSTIGYELSPTGGAGGAPDVVNNGGSGGSAMNATLNTSGYSGFGTSGITVVAGKFGNALQFDGSGSSLDIPSAVTDMSGGSIWTLSLWAKTTVPGGTFLTKTTPLVAGDTTPQFDTGASAFYLGANPIAPGGGAFPTAVRNAGGFLQSTTSVTDGSWHLITYVDNGSSRNIYVDGSLTTLSQTAFTTTDTSTGIRIGLSTDQINNSADGALNYQGDLDQINIYNAALTQTQIQDLFANNVITHSTPGAGGQLLPTGTDVNLSVSGATLDVNGNNQTIGSLTGVTGTSTLLEAGNLTTGGDNATTTYAGAITSSGGGLIKAGTGTLSLTGTNTYSGNTSVTGGALAIGAAGALPSGTNLNISANSSVAVVNHGANPRIVLQLNGLSTASTGTLDIANNDIVIHNGNLTTVNGQLQEGLNASGTLWAGPGGIVSSTAAANTHFVTGVGAIQNVDSHGNVLYGPGGDLGTSFDGVTGLSATDVLVKYTYVGDANLDGKINASDYLQIDNAFSFNAAHPSTPLTGWYNGDFNYDNVVNGDDYTLIDNAYNSQSQVSINEISVSPSEQIAAAPAAVPEPTTLSLVGIGAAATLLRRRRRGW